jgi:hypothetical protein
MSAKQEIAQWVEDAGGVWHFLIGPPKKSPLIADIVRDDSPNAPAGTYVGLWYKRGKCGGLIAGTNLAALKRELIKAYLGQASMAMRQRIRDGLRAAIDKRRSEYAQSSARHAEWIDTHAGLHDLAAIDAARVSRQ